MSLPCVIFDLDGTICDHRHRLHHLKCTPKNRVAFHDGCVDDEPYNHVLQICNALFFSKRLGGAAIFLCTGRPDSHRDQTIEWLRRHCVYYDQVMMRKADDHRMDVIVKKEMLDLIRSRGYKVLCAFEDRPDVVAMWQREGVPTFAMDYTDLKDIPDDWARKTSSL